MSQNIKKRLSYYVRLKEGKNDFMVGLCIIVEGEADAFAESIFGDMKPSWHYGIRSEEEDNTWEIFENVAKICLSPEDAGKYIFRCKELEIPQYAGYYFGIKIIREYMKKNQISVMKKILETPLDEIYKFYDNNIKLPINSIS